MTIQTMEDWRWPSESPFRARYHCPPVSEQARADMRVWRRANRAAIMLYGTRQRAKRYGVPCTLTLADVRALLAPMRCGATGLPLRHATGKADALSPSIDRIEPARGYVPGNVRLVCQRFNMLRRDAHVSRDAEFRDRVLSELGEVQP